MPQTRLPAARRRLRCVPGVGRVRADQGDPMLNDVCIPCVGELR